MSRTKRRRTSGFSLVEIIVALGVATILSGLLVFPLLEVSRTERGNEALNFIVTYRDDLMRTIQHQPSWDATVAAATENPEMDCLRRKTDCLPQRDIANRVTLFNADPGGSAAILNDSRNMSAGFTTKGQPCNSFSLTAPDDSCPIRVTISWRPQCGNISSGQPCINPELQLIVNFWLSSNNPALKAINATAYGFRAYRSSRVEGLQPTCVSMGGVFNNNGTPEPGDDTCVLSTLVNCPAGQSVIGFEASGAPRCAPLTATLACPPPQPPNYEPQFLQGVDSNGNVLCTPCP